MAHPAIAWQDDLKILQKWHNDHYYDHQFFTVIGAQRTKVETIFGLSK